MVPSPKIELLYFDGCPSYETLLPRLVDLLRAGDIESEVELVRVESDEDARRERFLGSPTVRVDGLDVEVAARERDDYGLKCRLYRVGSRHSATPPEAWVLAALQRNELR